MKTIEAFDSILDRSKELIRLYEALVVIRRRGRPPKILENRRLQDLLRASLVLAVSALDAYFHDKVGDELVPIVKRGLKEGNIPKSLMDILEDNKVFKRMDLLKWLSRDRPYVQVKNAIMEYLSIRSLQDPGAIQEAVSIIRNNARDYWDEIGRDMNIPEGDVRDTISDIVSRRHQIVHEGDLERSRRRKYQQRDIRVSDVKGNIDFISRFVHASEQVISRLK